MAIDAAAGSSISWTQLEPGDSGFERVIDLGPMIVGYRRSDVALKADGSIEEGWTAFTLTANSAEHARWNGLDVTGDDVGSTRGRYDFYASARSAFYTIMFRNEDLHDERRGRVPGMCKSLGSVPIEPALARSSYARNLRAFLRSLFGSGLQRGRGARTTARADLLWHLTAAVGDESETVEPSRAQSRRIEAVRICQQYIESHMGEGVTLLDLSEVSGLRPRSLINAFEAVTSTSPMAYLRAQRLARVRTMLQAARATKARIIDVAADWGFWHMGHFAAAYRAMYGETPSETLVRGLRGA